MSLEALDQSLQLELDNFAAEGRIKPPERIITGFLPPADGYGPRYLLKGIAQPFLRMNSNSYLNLSTHPEVINAADAATHKCGVGPGAVRFIDGTYSYHIDLEDRIAHFIKKPAAKIFNSAYTANCGLALAISNSATHWIGDQLNHNSIIRAMRIAGVPKGNKGIYAHNSIDDLKRCFKEIDDRIQRVIVIFDGVFSMRGDYAPVAEIVEMANSYSSRFKDGVITVIDDSHGLGAYGETGRGTPEITMSSPDIVVGTFGKAFGVNGGFIAASETVVEAVRQKADTYIYTNPLSVADCSAASTAIDICDSQEGILLLDNIRQRTEQFRDGLALQNRETIEGRHPVVPLMVRDTSKTQEMVKHLFDSGILAVGLTFPVVPRGDESIRFQINSGHTPKDIELVLQVINDF